MLFQQKQVHLVMKLLMWGLELRRHLPDFSIGR